MNPHQAFTLAVPVGPIDHVIGAEHAPITLVEYGDFECPNCRQAAPTVRLLIGRFPARIRFVFRHFPLEEIHGHALLAAQATEAANAQGQFWKMHDLLFAHQSQLQKRHLREYAEQAELDLARFDMELNDEIYLQRVREHIDGGRRSGVRATPGFFVNGHIQDVSFGIHQLVDSVEAELQRAHR